MPLSYEGLAAQIASSLQCRLRYPHHHVGNTKVTVAHLVRKFGDEKWKEARPARYVSCLLVPGERPCREHVIPVDCFTEHFLLWSDPAITAAAVCDFLHDHLLVAHVSSAENKLLRAAKLVDCMPKGWKFGDDPWKRYRVTKIFRNIRPRPQ